MLTNKVAIVTGGASGIGRAIATAYSRLGATVIVADISEVSELSREAASNENFAHQIKCDVSSEADVSRMVGETVERFGTVDILVNNAGIFPFSEVESTSLELWERVFATNVRGTFLCAKAVIPIMKRNGGGRIINIASSTFFIGLAGSAAYVASKGAIIGFTRSLARELGPSNIRVNTITPGLTKTPGVLAAGVTDDFFSHFAALQCLTRTQNPEDVVGGAVFLASDASDFMTGQIVNIDGGLATH